MKNKIQNLRFDCPECGKKRIYNSYKDWWSAQNKKNLCRSCGNKNTDYSNRPKTGVLAMHERNYLRPYEWLYNQLMRKDRKFVNSLTYEEFVEFTKTPICHYCGDEVKWCEYTVKGKGRGAYNLDRKDSSIGYTKENCVVACWICNRMKNEMSKEQFIQWIEKIYKYNYK